MAGPFSVAELARRLGGEVEGDGTIELVDARSLDDAGPEHLTFVASRRYARKLAGCRAGAVVMDRQMDAGGRTVIRVDHPHAAFARALDLFHPIQRPAPGVDPRAHVAPDAQVEGATVEAFAWVGPGAVVGRGTWVEAGAYVGAGARIGRDCRLMPGSVVYEGCFLGDRVWLNPGVVVGGQGFGFVPTEEGHLKVPQVGRAVVGDDVEIGANSCVDRGALGDTRVGRGTKIDDLVLVGHGVEVGEECILVAFTGVAGSTKVGKRVVFGAKAGATDHVAIGDGAQVAAGTRVFSSLPAGAKVAGYPAIGHPKWLRAATAFGELPALLKRVRELEARVRELEGRGG